MTTRKPLVMVGGVIQELPLGDSLPTTDAGTFDGGSASTSFTGVARIDCGGAS